MLISLTSATDIRRAHESFMQTFASAGIPIGDREVGFQGGAANVALYWLEAQCVWIGFRDDPLGEQRPSPVMRYWVPFGVDDPAKVRSLSITGEINSPHQGTYRRTGGVYAQDDLTRDLVVLHRGNMAGGRKGIGKTGFWGLWDGNTSEVMEAGKTVRLAQVANLSSPEAPQQLGRFAQRYAAIKRELVETAR
jgi:hypothetical protein